MTCEYIPALRKLRRTLYSEWKGDRSQTRNRLGDESSLSMVYEVRIQTRNKRWIRTRFKRGGTSDKGTSRVLRQLVSSKKSEGERNGKTEWKDKARGCVATNRRYYRH